MRDTSLRNGLVIGAVAIVAFVALIGRDVDETLGEYAVDALMSGVVAFIVGLAGSVLIAHLRQYRNRQ